MTSSPALQTHPPLLITIRFPTSLPDVDIHISSPKNTTVVGLKQALRSRIASESRLRFIYQGRILDDSARLTTALRPLPLASGDSAASSQDAKGKGKAADLPKPIRVYINCSIGDDLSPAELEEERIAAERLPDEASTSGNAPKSQFKRTRPRGFDRLLQAGFTQSEISTLRTQFASIHSGRFAPDAMPSPDTMRSMEDSWIDSNAGEAPSAGGSLDEESSGMAAVLDVLIKGMMIGFFFPLGSLAWLLRQGVWSEKWQIFVGSGVILSLTVGVVMSLSSDRP